MTGSAHAQALPSVSNIQYVVSPDVPTPGAPMSIEAQGVGGFLGDSNITWQQDGRTVLSGVGERLFTFTAPKIGGVTRIHVIIDSDQGTITHDFSFSPGSVNLLWEARTTVPPLYKGKALYSAGSQIKVIALSSVASGGSFVSPNSLSYKWTVNGNPIPQGSGLGRSTILFAGSQLNTVETVQVDVLSGSAVVAEGSIVIPATKPSVLMYAKDPLRGVLYDQALPSAVSLTGQEITINAEPFFFSKESKAAGTLTYTWTLGSSEVSGPDSDQGLLTLRQTGSGGGQSQLNVAIQNTDTTKLIQSAASQLRILFGTSNSSTFGL
jgi:hypothetical protein